MSSPTNDSDELTKTWDERPEVIRAFIDVRPEYEQLCDEVAYILKKRMDESGIEYSAVTSRAKTLKSFAEKISRKHYEEPLEDVTDMAGVRLVYLYKSNQSAIEKLIESEFTIVEKVDKVEQQDADKFGYGALHYLVKLGRKSSGARYDDLKGLVCEVQVRTVLQDAWAIIDHHLSYKQESDVPNILKRKLSSLSGLFEVADDQFDRVREEREEYRQTIKRKRINSSVKFLSQEINLDTLAEFLQWKFPKTPAAYNSDQVSIILSRAVRYGYLKLADLNAALSRTKKARAAMDSEHKSPYAINQVARAIALENPSYQELESWSDLTRSLFKKYQQLVESKKQ